jgi:hypothetical protein
MIRSFCTVLISLGLVFQPIAAAWSVPIADLGMDMPATSIDAEMDNSHYAMAMADTDLALPCHQANAPGSAADSSKDCCGINCPMFGQCTNSCAVSLFAVISKSTLTVEPDKGGLMLAPAVVRPERPSSSIFHPPKHS